MYAKFLLFIGSTLLLWSGVGSSSSNAQMRPSFTGNNFITVVLEGASGRYEFKSPDLLVRYNKITEQLECSVLINSLLPTSDTIPPDMAYDVLYGAKFPELVFLIDVPEEIINRGNPYSEPLNQRTYITLQGTTNQKRIPVILSPDQNNITFGTNFDLMLDNFRATIPVRYIPVLTGRLLINISNARWVDMR